MVEKNNMRVHEFAKKVGITSKELLQKLSDKGFDFSSHMSVLTQDAEVYLKNLFKGEAVKVAPKGKKSAKKEVKKEEPRKALAKEKVKAVAERPTLKKEALGAEEKKLAAPVKKEVKFKKPLGKSSKPTFRKKFQKSRAPVKELPKVVTEIDIGGSLVLSDAAKLMGKTAGDLIYALLKKGIVCNINSRLPIDTIKSLAQEFEIVVIDKSKKEAAGVVAERLERRGKGASRWPIVVVMGHVDHGKTTLLDYLRKINTVAKEKGGITQHIGAYEFDSVHGKIIFLDTPGHEAFSYLRKKGARVTDVAILIVSADDGVKPQTVEAIKHAQRAGVPIIVAINKIDKPEARAGIETVKREIAQYDLLPEDWGGKTICVPISAKTGEGVEELLEMIVLQSEMMELKADPNLPAKAFVLESRMEKGFGPVATVICVDGSLRQSDHFICGGGTGKVRLLVDSLGKKIAQAGPSIPVKVIGFDNFVSLGEWLTVVPREEYLKAKSKGPVVAVAPDQKISAELTALAPEKVGATEKEKHLNLVIKTDTHGSKEAIIDSVKKLSKQKKDAHCPIQIISSAIGDISEGDILLAENTGAYILGLHVKAEKNATLLAKEKNVKIKLYDIIYRMIEDLEKALLSKKEVVKKWVKVGELVVRKVFHMKKAGVIAGCYVSDGIINRNCKVVCIRGGKEIGEGKITSLQRERKDVKEVHAGYECGFATDRFHDWQVEDTVHVFSEIKEKEDEA